MRIVSYGNRTEIPPKIWPEAFAESGNIGPEMSRTPINLLTFDSNPNERVSDADFACEHIGNVRRYLLVRLPLKNSVIPSSFSPLSEFQ